MEEVLFNFVTQSLYYTLKYSLITGSCYFAYKAFKGRKTKFLDDLHQTIEDISCSTHIIGVQGSGKTFLAIMQFIETIEKGLGAIWLSTQGVDNSGILDYIPQDKVRKVILFKPHDKRPLGINLLKQYTGTSQERSLIADSVVVLFKRLFKNFSENMESVLTASVLAILEYSSNTNQVVTLMDLYKFFSDIDYMNMVNDNIRNVVVKDMIDEMCDEKNKSVRNSVDAILRRFRKLLYYDSTVAFLCHKEDDVDLLDAVNKRKIIICDFYAGGIGVEGLGKDGSKVISELMVSKMQLIAETRNINSSLFIQYYDEFQTYTSTSENIKDFIDLNRQRRMPVVLINQRMNQLSKELQGAVDNCGSKYILKLNPDDATEYAKKYPQYKDIIPKLEIRDCLTDIRSYGKNYTNIIKTKDIGEKYGFGTRIKTRNKGRCTAKEILDIAMAEPKESNKEEVDMSIFQ